MIDTLPLIEEWLKERQGMQATILRVCSYSASMMYVFLYCSYYGYLYVHAYVHTVEPICYGGLGTNHTYVRKCPYNQGVLYSFPDQ